MADKNKPKLLKPSEVAAMFRVDPKTVTRWAQMGRIPSILTPGGHRRFREDQVAALLADGFVARKADLAVEQLDESLRLLSEEIATWNNP